MTPIVIDALGIRDGRVSAPLRGPAPRVGEYVVARDLCNELHYAQVEAAGPSHVRLVLL